MTIAPKIIAIMAGMALSANAYLYIAWNGPSGFTMADGVTPLFSGPGIALVQLIFSPDLTADPALPGGGVGGNDTVLDEDTMSDSDPGNPYGAGFSFIYGLAPYQAGYVYVRVFEAGTSIGTVPVGAYYHTGPMFATVYNPGPPTVPDDVNAGNIGAGDGDYGTFRLTQQVVPEPSVLALAALGAAVVAIRRFRRS